MTYIKIMDALIDDDPVMAIVRANVLKACTQYIARKYIQKNDNEKSKTEEQ